MMQKTLLLVLAGTAALTATPFVFAQTTSPIDVNTILQERRIDPANNPQTLLRKCRDLGVNDRANCMRTGIAIDTLSSSSSSSSWNSWSSMSSSFSSLSYNTTIPALVNAVPALPVNCRSLQINGSTSAYTNADISNCLRPWISSVRANLNQLESWMKNNGIQTDTAQSSMYDWYNTSSLPASSGMSSSY